MLSYDRIIALIISPCLINILWTVTKFTFLIFRYFYGDAIKQQFPMDWNCILATTIINKQKVETKRLSLGFTTTYKINHAYVVAFCCRQKQFKHRNFKLKINTINTMILWEKSLIVGRNFIISRVIWTYFYFDNEQSLYIVLIVNYNFKL